MISILRSVAAAVLLVGFFAPCGYTQCPVQDDEDAPPEIATAIGTLLQAQGDEQLLPETGYLSNSRYTNVFFGIALDLPARADQRVMLPLMAAGQHALLALSFKNGNREGSITITASEPSDPIPQMTEEQRQKAFQQWAARQPQTYRQPPDWLMRSGHFYHVESHTGDKHGILYWARIKDYKLHFELVFNDKEDLRNAKQAMQNIHVYCAQDDGTLTTKEGEIVIPEGEPYQGPTIPTAHVDARLAEAPREHEIPPGEVDDRLYRNDGLGISVAFPDSWKVLDMRIKGESKAPGTPIAQRTAAFLQACSRTLIQVASNTPARSTDPVPTITLRALDPTCLSLRGPDTIRDRRGAEELGVYLEILREFGEIQFVNLVSASNQIVAIYRGTIGEPIEARGLSARESEVIFATRYRKMLLLWTLIAANGAELNAMPPTRVTFEGQHSIELGPALLKKPLNRSSVGATLH